MEASSSTAPKLIDLFDDEIDFNLSDAEVERLIEQAGEAAAAFAGLRSLC